MAHIRKPVRVSIALLGLLAAGSTSHAVQLEHSSVGAWEVIHFVDGASKVTATVEVLEEAGAPVVEVLSGGTWEDLPPGVSASGTAVRVADGAARVAWGVDAGDEIIWVGND